MQAERRNTQRVHVSAEDEWINEGLEFELVDLSSNGVGLRSNHPLKPHEHITITLEKGTSAKLEVIACTMTSPPDEYTDGEFRVGCRFLPKSAGKSIMDMLAKRKR